MNSVPSPPDVLFSDRSRGFNTGNWSAKFDYGYITRRKMVPRLDLFLLLPRARLKLGTRAREDARHLETRLSGKQLPVVLASGSLALPLAPAMLDHPTTRVGLLSFLILPCSHLQHLPHLPMPYRPSRLSARRSNESLLRPELSRRIGSHPPSRTGIE